MTTETALLTSDGGPSSASVGGLFILPNGIFRNPKTKMNTGH